MKNNPETWCGMIPNIYGYGIIVFETSEELVWKCLKKYFHAAKKANDGVYGFSKAMDYFGGRVFKIEMNKRYYDGIGD